VRKHARLGMTITLVVLLLAPALTYATRMSLEDCVRKALDLNLTIQDAREALSQSRSGINEARSGFLPNLSLSGSYNFLEETQKVSFPDPATGQLVDFRIDFTRDYSLQLGLTQALYTGGRLSSSYRIAKDSYEIAQADLETRQADVALEVIEAFYGLLLAREYVEVAEQAIETAEEFLRVVKARYGTGEASSFEVLRAEVEVSNLKPALIGARNGVNLYELALKTALNIEAASEIDFIGTFHYETFEIEPARAVRSAIENRPELRMIRIQKSIAEAGIRLAKAGRLPTLAISANYDVRSDKITLDSDKLEKTYAGYLVLSLPLFDGLKTKSQVSRSVSQVRQAEIAEARLEDAIDLEVRSSLLTIDAALETLRSQEKNVEMAEEGLGISNERYVQGYATNLEVMDAQLAVTRARNNEVEALHDLNLAVAKTKKAMGTLLGGYKVGARP
jgi:outer membrane protein